MKTKLIFKTVFASLILSTTFGMFTSCIPTNPIGTPTDTIVYHKFPNWSISDTTGLGNHSPNSKRYDINDDGVDDFVITNIIPQDYGYFYASLYSLNQTLVQGRTDQPPTDSVVYSYYIPEITRNHTISAQDTFFNDNIIPSARLFLRSVSLTISHSDTHYTGFKIMVNNQPHYAWVKFTEIYNLNVTTNPGVSYGTVKINESGFYKLPNTAIKAGIW